KRNVSILHVCAAHGIELKRHGTADYLGRCPFHDEDEASFIVTPSKNLWHCMGCDKGGSVIDLVMALDGLTFREAVDKLMSSNGLLSRGTATAKQNKHQDDRPEIPAERAAALLERAVTIYEKNLAESEEGRAYLDGRGITDAGLLTRHRAGYCNGKLDEILPGNGGVRQELAAVGILLDSLQEGTTPKLERFAGCVVFPVLDVDGNLVTLYGRHTGTGKKRHVFLPGRSTGLWNAPAMKTHSELIVVESVLDALSVEVAGFPNVVAAQGTNGLSAADIADMKQHGVTAVTLLLDGDDAGANAAAKLRPRLEAAGLAVSVKALPADQDPNSYLQEHGAEALARFLASDAWTPSELATPGPAPEQSVTRADGPPDQAPGTSSRPTNPGALSVTYGLRTYHVLGLEKGPRKLRATVRVEHAGKLHVDTLDFYSARSRRMLAQDLCRIFDEPPETIESDLTRLLQACEKQPDKAAATASPDPVAAMTAADRSQAEAFGRRPDLVDAILADYETCGLVGEEPNKLLAYLAATSRKTDDPLSVLVLSSSGAGKTALQDTALLFVPPEDLVKLTSLSGKALFYKDRLSLKHKVLALEEGDGAEEASYAIRNLISAGELVIESTIKDLGSGRLTTMENRVEGPSSVFLTTTNPDTDPETKSRFWVTSIDEGREQTRRILAFQRQRHTLDGLTGDMAVDAILKKHRNFQRLLKPVAIVNPYADRLTYGDDRLQGRRDQPKYLNLIKAVAFLRQMQKEVRYTKRNGSAVPFIEVDIEDVRVANKLAHEILGRSLDELSRPGRALLLLLDEMVEQIAERLKEKNDGNAPKRTSISFTRREIREATGWAHTRVHRYLKELIELEYVLIDSGRNGTLCRYRLAYEGQGKKGERFMLGLVDPEDLA
ncbi:toprim domain-containing protein, partial [candidate division KSB3 bacterium]|nr:toprim domain-containing protein [candidate division KSB3 bacterium]